MTQDDPTKTHPRVGRVRRPTRMEIADPDALLRPDAVLALAPLAADAPLTVLERHVGDLIDGFRPVARIKKKSGLGTVDVVLALRQLRERGLLKLVGVVEETFNEMMLDDFTADIETMPHGANDVIPPHIMNEIAGMLVEEQGLRAQESPAATTQRTLSAIESDEE
jgi:hypothetical protein